MDEEVKKLKLEIEVLKKRVAELERIERNRKIVKIIKVVIIIVILVVIFIFIYKWYTDIMNNYNKIQEFINNPLKDLLK